jgi:hypothetical protein
VLLGDHTVLALAHRALAGERIQALRAQLGYRWR